MIMKNLLLLLCLLSFEKAIAQAPQAIPYQAVARDSAGILISNQNISLRFSIHDSTANGTIVYQETHSAMTNEFGLFTVNIGQGTPVIGAFNFVINWGMDPIWLQVELDTAGGSSYVNIGTQQMLSVPYALFANAADSSLDNRWNVLDTNIYNSNPGNVGIGIASPKSKLTVKGNMSIGDSASELIVPQNGLRVEGPVLIGVQPFFSTDGGFIVIDDGRVRKYNIGLSYKGNIDSSITNTGIDMNISASDSVSGSKMNLESGSDTAVVIGNRINGSGSGEKFIGISSILHGWDGDDGTGPVLVAYETTLQGSDSITGSNMSLIGENDSTNIIGNTITGSGIGKKATGYIFKTDKGVLEPYVFYRSVVGSDFDISAINSATGSEVTLTASDSVTGQKVFLSGNSDTAIVIGERTIVSGTGKKFIGVSRLMEDEQMFYYFSLGSDIRLVAEDSVVGEKFHLTGGSDSASIIGVVILPEGTGSSYTGYYTNNLDSGDTGTHEVGHWMGNNAVGSDIRLIATDSVTGSSIRVVNGNDSTKVRGIVINRAVDPDNLPGDWSSTQLTMMQTNDGWKNVKGTDLILGATQSVTGHKLSLTGKSDSSSVTGLRVFPRGIGKNFKGFSTSFIPEVDDEVLIIFPTFKNAVGAELIVTGTDSVIGCNSFLYGSNDSSIVIGQRISNNGKAKEFIGNFTIASNEPSTICWRAVGLDAQLTASDSVTGSRFSLNGLNPGTYVQGQKINIVGQGANIGTDISVTGGSDNIGLRSFTNGSGAAAIFSGTSGAKGLLVPDGNVGIGTNSPTEKLDVNGTVKIGTNGTTITNIIKATSATAPLVILPNTTTPQTYNINNTVTGSSVMVSPGSALSPGLVIAYSRVSAANTVEVSYRNTTAAPVNLVPGIPLYISVIQ